MDNINTQDLGRDITHLYSLMGLVARNPKRTAELIGIVVDIIQGRAADDSLLILLTELKDAAVSGGHTNFKLALLKPGGYLQKRASEIFLHAEETAKKT